MIKSSLTTIPIIGFISLLFICSHLNAQNHVVQLSENQTKVVFLYNLMKYTIWPERDDRAFYTLGIYGDNQALYDEFKTVSGQLLVHGKPVKPISIDNIQDARALDALFVTKSASGELSEIASQLIKTETLLISDNAVDQQAVMINLIYPDGKHLGFEANSSNIIYEGLDIDDKILLYGGTKIDVATLYKEMQFSLRKMKDKVEQQKKELLKSLSEIENAKSSLVAKNLELNETIQKTVLTQSQLRESTETLVENERKFVKNKRKLDAIEISLVTREGDIDKLEDKINSNLATLKNQQNTISKKNTLMLGIVVIFFLSFMIAILLFVFYRQKVALSHEKHLFDAESKVVEAQAASIKAFESNLVLKNDFMMTVSHELRTPMNGIMGWIQLSMGKSSNEMRRTLGLLQSSASEMMGLIDNILTYTEIQSGELKLRSNDIYTKPFLKKLEEHYQEICSRKGLSLDWCGSSDLPRCLSVDEEKLTIVLNKLLNNAIKFTKKGGVKFEVNCDNQCEPWQLSFTIQDSGVGINAQDQTDIFKAFRQKEGGFNRTYSGLGIGLAICQKLVENMGGILVCTSEDNKGSSFSFSIPTEVAEFKEDKNKSKSTETCHEPILIVEDNLVNQKILKKMLESLGYRSVVANHGEEALSLLETESLSLILMDLQMPVMDGFTCTEQIRHRDDLIKDIPIVAVTANLMSSDQEHCLAAGMDDFLKKPVDLKLLASKVAKYASPVDSSGASASSSH